MPCTNKLLTQDVIYDCSNPPKQGLEDKILLINIDDIDKTTTTFDANNELLVTDLKLKSGKKGVFVKGVEKIFNSNFEIVKYDWGVMYKHKVSGKILTPDAQSKLELYKLIAGGGKYVAVVKRNWGGANNQAKFMILGWDNGLAGSLHTYDASANDGAELFELTSIEKNEEAKPTLILLEGDYDATNTAFNNAFQTA